MGQSICYDAEFPLIARAQAHADAWIILIPSAINSMQGYWCDRTGAQARALENQCNAVQAAMVGEAPWLPSLDSNNDAAAVYGPPYAITPDNGVFALGEANRPQWLSADGRLAQVDRWRCDGIVLLFRHWPEQLVTVRSGGASKECRTSLSIRAGAN